ncbi:hypothetical protein BASA81_013995 [Batrachochytrium salamandrivorans]|nr:hypothetical protein BASA81_013995 [Batrachochytrium salamandrivorans]
MNFETVKTVAKRTAAVVLLIDVIHCYRYVSNAYLSEEGVEGETEQERLLQDAQILAAYQSDCNDTAVVSRQEFESRVQQALDLMESDANGQDSLKHRLESPLLKVNREAVIFAGGGRAAFMQLAHPFVAAGIRDHSYLQRGVSRRFFNTFKYVFGMTFGTGPEVVEAAKGVRGLHAKVHGEIEESVGIFSPKARFDANQKDAMRYVQWTLLDTAVFEYELHVGWLTEAEKDEMARASAKFLLLFGVPVLPGEENITYKQFKRRLDATLRSKLISVSDTALDTQEYILLPPAPQFAPLMGFVKWSTLVSLPPRLGFLYGGRMYNTWVDRLFFALAHGLIRFQTRLLPGSFRYLAAYWKMHERVYGPRGMVSNLFSSLSAAIVKLFLAVLMPDRDEDKAIAAVKAIRAKRVPFDKTTGSPLQI